MVILFICIFILVNLNFILFNSYSILTKSLYLGLEIILFMLVSPLVDESSRPEMKLGFWKSLNSKFGKKVEESIPIEPIRKAAERKVIDSRPERNFQEKEPAIDQEAKTTAIEPPSPAPDKVNSKETVPMDTPPSIAPIGAEESHSEPEMDPFQEPRPFREEVVSYDEASAQKKMESSPLSGSSPDLEQLKSLGRYQVVEIVGKGAMGTVLKGIDPAINRPVALKTIRLEFMSDQTEMEELRDRLMREARAAGKLSHPNIVTIYDIGSENNIHYIAMEYLEGQTLENLIKRKVQFSYKIIANIIAQICKGLQYAHDQGIIHRDVKPANIMVLPDYTVKVMDFGIARVDSTSMTKTGIAMGTPNYIAPELLQGKSVDRRCDIFSLGVVLYELLTGRRPFKGENLTSLIFSIINDNPPQPSKINENIPLIFDHIAMRALNKNPLERFQKASDMMNAMADFVGSFSSGKKIGM
jgi:tRNA A-37 threonylcarbamoyl transferase component Bud32